MEFDGANPVEVQDGSSAILDQKGEAIEDTEDSSLPMDGLTESNQISEPEVTDKAAPAPQGQAIEDAEDSSLPIDGFTESNQTSEPEVTDEAASAPQGEAMEETDDSSLAIDGFTESNQISEPEVTDEAAPAPQGQAMEDAEDSSLPIDGFTESNQTSEPEVTDEAAPAPQGEAIGETEDSSLANVAFTESNQTSEPEVTDEEAALAPQDIDGYLELIAALRDQQIAAAPSGSESKRETGTIKRFHDKKGYGYISPDSGGNDVFIQLSSIQSFGSINIPTGLKVEYGIKIPTGLKVEYGIKIDRKGRPEAVNVTVVQAEEEFGDTNPISSSAIETHVQSGQEHHEVQGSYNANKSGVAWAENNKTGQKSALDPKAWPSLPDVPKTSTTSIKIIAPKVIEPKVTEAASASQGAGSKSKRQTGTIKWFNDDKRYGFILQDSGRSDVFFHKSSVKSDHTFLWEGMKVEYDIVRGQEGKPKAVDVKVRL